MDLLVGVRGTFSSRVSRYRWLILAQVSGAVLGGRVWQA